jgi:hypothetical protein
MKVHLGIKIFQNIEISSNPGPMFRFLKYFRQKKLAKNLTFLTQNKAKFCKHFIIKLVAEKNATFFAEN